MVMIHSNKIRATSFFGSGNQITGVHYPEWMNEGLCVGKDPEAYCLRSNWRSDEEIAEYKRVADACYDCPVMIKCGEEAKLNRDTNHTIRGGIIPPVLLTNGRGRPAGGMLVKRGKCTLGHIIRSEEDTINAATCKQCHLDYVAYHGSDASDECGNGHPYIEENIRYARRVDRGRGVKLERRCGVCTAKRQVRYRAKKNDAKLAM